MTATLRDGTTTEDPRLDRLVQFDERSRNFQVRPLLAEAPRRRVRTRLHRGLNQGQEGACTWFATAQRLNAAPRAIRPKFTNERARELYFEAQKIDQWPGGAYPGATPHYEGSSVLAAMKVAHREGFISSYRWIGAGSQSAVDDLVDTCRYVGGVVMGTWWLRSMFTTLPNGRLVVEPSSEKAGGHAWATQDVWYGKLAGETKSRLYGVVQNSWGEDGWGVKFRGVGGCAFVEIETDMEWLLSNQGEGAVPLRA